MCVIVAQYDVQLSLVVVEIGTMTEHTVSPKDYNSVSVKINMIEVVELVASKIFQLPITSVPHRFISHSSRASNKNFLELRNNLSNL